jgi:sulfide:quinone oxidoreductase
MPVKVLIIGGGFGGLAAATELAKLAGSRVAVTVIDREPRFFMGFTKLWVAVGRRKAEECMHPRERLSRQGVEFILDEARGLDASRKELLTGAGPIPYDKLVLAPGLAVVPEAVPGLAEHGLNLYQMSGAEEVHAALRAFAGGDILLAVCAMPFKCPPAPYEAALLLDDFLRARGVRDKARIAIATPEPRPVPVLAPEIGNGVLAQLGAHGVDFIRQAKLARVEKRTAHFENGTSRSFDLLIAVPPHRPPPFAAATAGLTDASGFILVDKRTLATPLPDVYAVGDAAKVTTATGAFIPRAGIFAEGQAKIVARNLATEATGGRDLARFDGTGYCFLETGGGRALRVEGDFFAEPTPTATLDAAPSPENLQAKEAFEAKRIRAWFST